MGSRQDAKTQSENASLSWSTYMMIGACLATSWSISSCAYDMKRQFKRIADNGDYLLCIEAVRADVAIETCKKLGVFAASREQSDSFGGGLRMAPNAEAPARVIPLSRAGAEGAI